ncbi:MAG TPA: 50S ribosomal protein L18 [Dissulfurispiraceae bacterium]|nr:50S ribosomal protein L18 [Dissulfurispiraceae bacterium]
MIAKKIGKQRRHERIRKHVSGNPKRPRLSVYRSLNNVYAQIIDDTKGATLAAASTLDKEIKGTDGHKGNVEAAKKVGQLLAKKALAAGVKKVVFDRSGYRYHGSIKALAEGSREGGLEF